VPDLIIIAGPNGSGKTTFAREYLSSDEMRFEFVNADEIARAAVLETGNQSRSDVRAGRIMLDRVDELVDASADFVKPPLGPNPFSGTPITSMVTKATNPTYDKSLKNDWFSQEPISA
jgi:predicted ABC-type ATPase